jgi:hypothetical protein
MVCHLILLALLQQQLEVEPFPAVVGQPVAVRATAAGQPLPAVDIEVVLPDGGRSPVGTTDATGAARFVATDEGLHTFVAAIGGVRVLAPLSVLPLRRRWPWVIACVPLGLVLLLRIWRAPGRGDRDSATAAAG